MDKKSRALALLVTLAGGCLLPDVGVSGSTRTDKTVEEDAGAELGEAGRLAAGSGGRSGRAGRGGEGGAGGSAGRVTVAGGASAPIPAAGSGGTAGKSAGAGAAGTAQSPTESTPIAPTVMISPDWSTPEILEKGATKAHSLTTGRNRAGDVALGWWQNEANGYLWIRRFAKGSWDPLPVFFSGGNPGDYYSARTGIDREGNSQVYFVGYDTGLQSFRAYWSKLPGQEVSESQTVAAAPVADGQVMTIPLSFAVTDAGLATVVYMAATDPVTKLQKLYWNSLGNAGWGTPRNFDEVPNEGNNVQYTWATNANAEFVLNHHPPSTTPQTSIQTWHLRGDEVVKPPPLQLSAALRTAVVLTLEDAGNAVALWLQDAGLPTGGHLYSARYHANSRTWQAPERRSEGEVTEYFLEPRQGGGVPVATWFEETETTSSFYRGRFWTARLAGGEWETKPVTGEVQHLQRRYMAGSNAQGATMLVWLELVSGSDGSVRKVLRFSRAGTNFEWSAPSDLFAFEGDIDFASLTVAEDGRALLVWNEAAPGVAVPDLKWSRSN